MCGIVQIIRFDGKSAHRMVERRYQHQKTRGQLGFGFVAVEKDLTIKVERATTEKEILKSLDGYRESAMILFHHRMPTSMPNYKEGTHPIKVSDKSFQFDYYVAHNGIISNEVTLKKEHDDLKIEYSTLMDVSHVNKNGEAYKFGDIWNDSETLAVELALYIEGKKTVMDARGSIAFVLYQVDKDTQKIVKMYYGRNETNPLFIHRCKEFMSLCSQSAGDLVEINKLHCYDPLTGELGSVDLKFNPTWERESVGTGTYKYPRVYDEDDYEYRYPAQNLLPSGKMEDLLSKAEQEKLEGELFHVYEDMDNAQKKLEFAQKIQRPEEEIEELEGVIEDLEISAQKIEAMLDEDVLVKETWDGYVGG
jgi:predicted glutamine amidotransferase